MSKGVAKVVHEEKTEVCCLNLLNCWPETALPVAKYPIASLCLTDRWFQTATPQNWPKQGSLCLLNLPERQLFVVPALAKPQNLTLSCPFGPTPRVDLGIEVSTSAAATTGRQLPCTVQA